MPAPGREKRGSETLTTGAPLAVLLAAGLLIAYELLPVLELVAVAMLLALVIRTVANRLHEAGLRPWMSVAVLLISFATFGSLVWLVVAPRILAEVSALAAAMPGYADSLTHAARRLNEDVGFVPDLSHVADQIKGRAERGIESLPRLLAEVGHTATSALATFILAVFMAYDPGVLISGVLKLVPPGHHEATRRLMHALEKRLRGWIVGTGLAMIFLATGAGLGLWIVGAPLPITFALLAGLLNVIPYIGSIVGALLPALLALSISPLKALLVVVLFVILNQIDGYVIQPMVMGHEARLHPVVVILSFLFLGKLLGFAGLLLSVPTAVFLMTVFDELGPKEGSKDAPGETAAKSPASRDARSSRS
ncbi:MAG TPA: AI-2E family transporter [Rubrobacteraceae bacterium]|nr:AI-2E family transporter [Rubrobacteraceae bacterium]